MIVKTRMSTFIIDVMDLRTMKLLPITMLRTCRMLTARIVRVITSLVVRARTGVETRRWIIVIPLIVRRRHREPAGPSSRAAASRGREIILDDARRYIAENFLLGMMMIILDGSRSRRS